MSGTVFGDTNANGVRDAGEAGLAGWTVFVDLHASGSPAADDPSAVTASDGTYSIAGVPSGTYLVRTVQQPGFTCTLLGGCIVMQRFPVASTLVADFGELRSSTVTRPPPSVLPPPALGKSFLAGVVSGSVLVKLPPGARTAAAVGKGTGFVPLIERRSLPVGSILDTTRGVVRVTSAADAAGQTQAGVFAFGVFAVLQDRRQRGLTQLNLVVGRAASLCPPIGKVRSAARRLLAHSVLAKLRADAKGRFLTRGRFSSATVRGTSWDTVDRCDGTLTTVRRGVVAVLDRRRHRTVLVPAGRSYLARAR